MGSLTASVQKIQALPGEKTTACAWGSPDLVGRTAHGGSRLTDHDLPFQIPTLPSEDTAHRFDAELALSAITLGGPKFIATGRAAIGRQLRPFQRSTKFSSLVAPEQSVQFHDANASVSSR